MLQRLMLAAVLVLLAIACAIVTQSRTLTGKVVSIADGDTLTLLVDQEQIRVRLEGIDAPERSQSFGTKAGEALGDLVYAKTVTVRSIGTDRYGRTLGRIFVRSDAGETIDVNARLVEQGFAWWYREYSDDKMLIAADKAAREARRGLWADPSPPLPPWEFRARQGGKQAALSTEPRSVVDSAIANVKIPADYIEQCPA